MALLPPIKRTRPVLGGSLFALVLLVAHQPRALAQSAAVGVYAEASTEHDTLITPRISVVSPAVASTALRAGYALDVISHASVDIRTSRPPSSAPDLHHELELEALHQYSSALRLAARYRFTTRYDYTSHTGVLMLEHELAQGAAVLSAVPYVRGNHIERVGDPTFSRSSGMFGLRLGLRQLLDRASWLQLNYELQYAGGYLSSPYQVVGIGDNVSIGCIAAVLCVRDERPDSRFQHAVALNVRRALSATISTGLVYRFYIDDWSLTSHTLEPDVSWMITPSMLLRLRYRGYLQTAAAFYRPDNSWRPGEPVTADVRLSAMQTHRVGCDFEMNWALRDGARVATLFAVGARYIKYGDRPDLASVRALDATVWALLAL